MLRIRKPALVTAFHSSFCLLVYGQVRLTPYFHGDYDDKQCVIGSNVA